MLACVLLLCCGPSGLVVRASGESLELESSIFSGFNFTPLGIIVVLATGRKGLVLRLFTGVFPVFSLQASNDDLILESCLNLHAKTDQGRSTMQGVCHHT